MATKKTSQSKTSSKTTHILIGAILIVGAIIAFLFSDQIASFVTFESNNTEQTFNTEDTSEQTDNRTSQNVVFVQPLSIETGATYSCAIRANKTFCWGDGSDGRLGTGNVAASFVPAAVATVDAQVEGNVSLAGIVAVSSGQAHSCALRASGQVVCWGSGANGRLGTGNVAASFTPVTVMAPEDQETTSKFLEDVVQVSAGAEHTCAVTKNGEAVCWGSGANGRLGTGNVAASFTPVKVLIVDEQNQSKKPLTGVQQITTGAEHSCALLENTQVVCWGSGGSGRLGQGSVASSFTPVAVLSTEREEEPGAPLDNITEISAGAEHTCAVTKNGEAVCWGNGANGRLGTGNVAASFTPVKVRSVDDQKPLTGVQQITTGAAHSCALLENSQAVCWGNGANGRLGTGNVAASFTPVTVLAVGATIQSKTPLTAIKQITAGAEHSCAQLKNRQAVCWGKGANGRLGRGNVASSFVPVLVDESDSAW